MSAETKFASFAHPFTREFFQAAHQVGAIYQDALLFREESLWWRNIEITILYFSTPSTLQELGEVYQEARYLPTGRLSKDADIKPLSRQRVKQIVGRTVYHIHQNCPPEVQQQFPLSNIPPNKPVSRHSRKQAAGPRFIKVCR